MWPAWVGVVWLAALVVAVGPAAARAEGVDCPPSAEIKVSDARLAIVPELDLRRARITLSGHASLGASGAQARMRPGQICAAALGPLQVNAVAACRDFDTGFFSPDDRIVTDASGVNFELAREARQDSTGVYIALHAGERVCADRLVVELKVGPKARFSFVDGMPASLTADHAAFELAPRAQDANLLIGVGIDRVSDAAATGAGVDLKGPPSWNLPFGGNRVRLQDLSRPLILTLAVFTLIGGMAGRHPIAGAKGSVWSAARSPLITALGFYATATLLDARWGVTNLIFAWLAKDPNLSRMIFTLDTGGRSSAANLLIQLGVLAILLAAVGLAWGLVALLARRHPEPERRPLWWTLEVFGFAALLGFASILFAAAMWPIEQSRRLGFEAPALVLSLAFALLAIGSLRKLLDLSAGGVLGISVLAALTVFFPIDAVVRSTGGASIAENTAQWAQFISFPMARFLYVGALAVLAYWLAADRKLDRPAVARWIGFLLLMQVAAFSIATPTNALAIAGVLLVAERWLFAPTSRAARPDDAPVPDREGEMPLFWLVGGGAALIFLLQFVFRTGPGPDSRFGVLGLAGMIPAFATGATAGLLLGYAMPMLRGDSATLKAANISLMIVCANLASGLDDLRGRAAFIGALVEYMNVAAALILVAVIYYDLARVKSVEGQWNWRDLFKGTTLASAIPIISAVAAATLSAISPIFSSEIGAAFSQLLKAALPQPAG